MQFSLNKSIREATEGSNKDKVEKKTKNIPLTSKGVPTHFRF